MPKYVVYVVQKSTSSRDVIVDADNEDLAMQIALEKAEQLDFHEPFVNYAATDAIEITT